MSDTSSLDAILRDARQKEQGYDWPGAAESYRKALGLMSEDSSKSSEIHEWLGYAVYRAAFQAESSDQFRERMGQALVAYRTAKELYQKLDEMTVTAKKLRCYAMIAYIGYWLASEASEKKRLLNECWRLTKEALEAFEDAENALGYGTTYNQFIGSAIFAFTFESSFEEREKIMKSAVEYGEQAVKFLSKSDEVTELARTYAKTVVCLGVFGFYFRDIEEREKYCQKGLGYWQKAKELSEDIAMTEFLYPVFGGQPFFGLEGSDEALANYEKALEYARKTKDKFFIGCALDWLVYHTGWRAEGIEDPEERVRLFNVALQYGDDARQQFSKISFISSRGDYAWIGAYPADTTYFLANSVVTDMEKKRELFENALQAAPEMVRRAENSAYPEVTMYAHAIYGRILLRLAILETDEDKKRRLLEDALEHGSEVARIVEQLTPFLYWNRGVEQGVISKITSGLASLAKDPETKRNMLNEAVLYKEKALNLMTKELAFFQGKRIAPSSLFADLGSFQSDYGDTLSRLYGLTHNRKDLKKAIEAFGQATESFRKLDLRSRTAECYWKTAQTYDTLGEHPSSAQNFDLASKSYESATESIPQLKEFYKNSVLYMQAWSEIERARHHHRRQEYGLAEDHFRKAADLHKSLKQWSYLASNYAAWAHLEHAEELSRKEKSEEAFQAFGHAARLFEDTKKSIQNQLVEIENMEEKEMAANMLKATDLRNEYCLARIAVEEAKILDKKGDHNSSSQKYNSAAEAFEKITQAVGSDQDRQEFRLIAILSKAWAKMTQAEAEEAPNLYLEASQLFEEAKEISPNEKTKTLALGHSRFCKALEAGTKFADTGDPTFHTAAEQHLESAGKYYVKAGFQNASEYAKATELLLDAYLHMDKAKKESDPDKKTRLFFMAEKLLQTSAGSFMKAEHPEKREQVLRLLENVKDERELAVSLSEVLHAPSIVSTTAAFNTPTPNQENAVGLERFEQADIQANLTVRQKELKIGELLNLEIELVNAGKAPALLIKVNEAIPEGFELVEKPDTFRVEDRNINLRGKRLDPLKGEDVRLVLKPKLQGAFALKPIVLYLDENGKYKSHEPEPITVIVKELGIKGWLKGER